jgi:hypothetical protein
VEKILTVNGWDSAFVQANALLAEDELTAIAAMPDWKFKEGDFPITHLEESGDPWEALADQQRLMAEAHGERHSIALWHGKRRYDHRGEYIDGWLLVFVFPN